MSMKLIRRYLTWLSLSTGKLNDYQLKSLVEPVKKATILDLGCNDGRETGKRFSGIQYPRLYGVDINPEMVKLAKKQGIHARTADANKRLPFSSNLFDVVGANQVIEHLRDVDTFVAEIYRVLRPGGYLILSTENLSSWHNIFALVLGWQPFSEHISAVRNIGNPWRLGQEVGYNPGDMHVRVLTLCALKELFTLHNLVIEQSFGIGYYPFPSVISKLLSKIDPVHAACIGLKARKPKMSPKLDQGYP